MRSIPCFFFLCSFAFSVHAQDTLFLRSAAVVIAKVIEVNPVEVKYKRFDFQDGPTYVELKTNIRMIAYAGGMKETFAAKEEVAAKAPPLPALNRRVDDHKIYFGYQGRKLTQPQMWDVLLSANDPKVNTLVSEAKRARRIEFCWLGVFPLSLGAIYSLDVRSFNGNYNESIPLICFAGAIACPIISGINKSRKMKANSAAIKLYNEQFND
ncbi:MAG: hypothetical protein ACJ77K_05160 [Bacteroidia bacterium]